MNMKYAKRKYIDIFEIDRNGISLYEVMVVIIIFLGVFQFIVNYKSFCSLNDYVEKNKDNISEQIDQPEEGVNKKNTTAKIIQLDKLKDTCSIIGNKNIKNISVDGNEIEMKGICEDTEILKKLSKSKNILNISIDNLQKENGYFLFTVRYELGG